ncbi:MULTISPECIES: hypothetical protein [unclassified Streptomyces]|uniref:hypothetical protein n=1 Tax=Streptomycetaceae TaxID=2062 RepID=UPI002E79EB26|nr:MULTISPECIES: hypothetical protein [unclassified Streptomyces]MED7948343.1 hypothetical protein [Streptomyces sp. BE303]MEE1823898.1 hypothetical protein [Streptomyces sp. BE20]
MSDEKTLAEAVDALADRFRSMPQSRLHGVVPGHASRAAAALALARWLAAAARAVEGGPVRELPEAGAFAVGDQLAVTGHDLVAALAGLPGDDGVALPAELGGPSTVAAVRAEASARVARAAALCH